MVNIRINEELCKGCGFCIAFCPRQVLGFSGELSSKGFLPAKAQNPEKCTICRFCELICPDFAISVADNNQGRCDLKQRRQRGKH